MDWSINWLAVIVAGIAYFLVGWVWYSALFGKIYRKEMGADTSKKPESSKMMRMFGLTFLYGIVMSIALSLVLRAVHADTVGAGIAWALVAGIGFAVMVLSTNAQYEGKSLALQLINAGYPIAGYIVMSIVLTLWK